MLARKNDDRVIQHLCERGKGHFVRNVPPKEVHFGLWPEYLLLEKHFFATHQTLREAVADGRVSKEEETAMRRRWRVLQSEMEGFLAACARGVFRHMALFYPLLAWFTSGALEMLAEAG